MSHELGHSKRRESIEGLEFVEEAVAALGSTTELAGHLFRECWAKGTGSEVAGFTMRAGMTPHPTPWRMETVTAGLARFSWAIPNDANRSRGSSSPPPTPPRIQKVPFQSICPTSWGGLKRGEFRLELAESRRIVRLGEGTGRRKR
jgi:hypothetical protein